jgi:hypothetical protein
MNELKQRSKAMCRSIRISWSSLKSHLQYAIDPVEPEEDHVFHANAIVEYAQAILICAKELRHLNLERKNAETSKKTLPGQG